MSKCEIRKDKFCGALDEIASSQYDRGRRIYFSQTINMKTGKQGTGVCYQRESKKGYVWLNFCPWCGGDLSKRKSKPKPAKTE